MISMGNTASYLYAKENRDVFMLSLFNIWYAHKTLDNNSSQFEGLL